MAAAIEKVFASHHSITKEDFASRLAARGIQAVFKGSELSKDYSWNNLSKRFGKITVEK